MPLSVTAFQIMYFKWFVTALEGIEASWGHSDKKPTCQYRRNRFVPWLRKSPGVGNGNPQYPCLENSMDKEAWRATQSMGLQRVRHDWVHIHICKHTHTEGMWLSINSTFSHQFFPYSSQRSECMETDCISTSDKNNESPWN